MESCLISYCAAFSIVVHPFLFAHEGRFEGLNAITHDRRQSSTMY